MKTNLNETKNETTWRIEYADGRTTRNMPMSAVAGLLNETIGWHSVSPSKDGGLSYAVIGSDYKVAAKLCAE